MTSKAKKNVQKQTPPVERGGGSGGEGVTGSIQKQNITRYPNEYKRYGFLSFTHVSLKMLSCHLSQVWGVSNI
jgi:hypothetical protein